MIQSPLVGLLVQFPMLQLLQVPRLPLLCLRQPFLPPFMADDINIDRVVVAGVGRKKGIIPIWRVDCRPAFGHHGKGEAAEFLSNSVTLACG